MVTESSTTEASTPKSATASRGRKVRAILAGGLVLGLGATITLAAWNDSEFGKGDFKAGTFNLEGSTDGTSWAEHAAPAAAAVVFDIADHGNLSPTDVVYKSFWVRLAAGTTSAAALSLAGVTPGSGGNEANLAYQIYANPPACDSTGAASGTSIGSGTSLSIATPGTSVPLAIGSPTDEAGTPVQLCFAVTAGTGLVQSAQASTIWEFEAVSED